MLESNCHIPTVCVSMCKCFFSVLFIYYAQMTMYTYARCLFSKFFQKSRPFFKIYINVRIYYYFYFLSGFFFGQFFIVIHSYKLQPLKFISPLPAIATYPRTLSFKWTPIYFYAESQIKWIFHNSPALFNHKYLNIFVSFFLGCLVTIYV